MQLFGEIHEGKQMRKKLFRFFLGNFINLVSSDSDNAKKDILINNIAWIVEKVIENVALARE